MDKRTCCDCDEEISLDEFPFRNKAEGTRQRCCKACTRKRSGAWYRSNKKRHAATSARASKKWKAKRYAELKAEVDKIKSAPCTDCRVSYGPWVMQFDHLDGSTKVDAVARMVHDLKSLAAILLEISKCELVCSNCHANRTHKRKMNSGRT